MPRLHNTLKSLSSECAKMFQGINITPPCALVSSAKSLMSFLLKVMTEQDAKAMPATSPPISFINGTALKDGGSSLLREI